jgi:hypothetical protein
MVTEKIKTIVLGCACSLLAPFSSFAQTGTTAAPLQDVAGGDPFKTLFDDAATASMQRSVTRAMMAVFSFGGSVAEVDPARFEETTFFLAQVQGSPQPPKPPAPSPPGTNPPGPNQAPPSIGDLGFPPAQTQGNPQDQARLDKRSHMLKIHQRLGLITTVPLIATVISGGFAGGKSTSSSARDLHAALGSLTGGLYFTTAYYSIFAPKIPGTQTRGPIRLHKALAWIHGPGMILTPILGVIAFDQKSRGEKVHGIASAHGPVAIVTAAAYGLAIVSVSFKF